MPKRLTTDERTMSFLSKRTCLVVVTAEGQCPGTYVQSENVTILGRGTGVFLENRGRSFVATNDHVIRAHICQPQLKTRVHIALQSGRPFAEFHDGYAHAQRNFKPSADDRTLAAVDAEGQLIPLDADDDTDLAVVRLTPASAQAAHKAGRKFVKWTNVRETPLVADERVYFRGYPEKNAHYVEQLRRFDVDGFSLVASVVEVRSRRVIVNATESAVWYGRGQIQTDRDLHGISGSGMFDKNGKLAAIVYGGDPDQRSIFACPANQLAPLLERLS